MRKIYQSLLLFFLLILWNGASAQVTMMAPGVVLAPDTDVPVTNVQGVITNQLVGSVWLTWDCVPSAGFINYSIKRNGVILATTSVNSYNDVLPALGSYTYCVEAVYASGSTTPSCVQVEWVNPSMSWTPSELITYVYSGGTNHAYLTIANTGAGALSFEFPDYSGKSGDSPLAYCPASASSQDEFISNVQFGTINQSSGWAGYSDYTAISTDLVKGVNVPITVTVGPPNYSGDITGVWIDYDHNNSFDAYEFTALTGTSIASGFIGVPLTALPGLTTMRVRTQFNGTLSPCGTTTYGEVEDYSVNILNDTFIISVSPTSGIVAAGASVYIDVVFSAQGSFAPTGVYDITLSLNSNDPNHLSVNIPATMIVGLGSTIEGVVTDTLNNPLNGVLVQAGSFSTMTNESGNYSLWESPGTYTVVFSKLGYQSVSVPGIVTTEGNMTTLDTKLWEEPYPPACAHAIVNSTDTQCDVTWCLPAGPYEMLYDDGTIENSAAWLLPGNMNAVKFTPQGYPATISGARFYIENGPTGNCIGSTLIAEVYSANASGLPGIMLDIATVTISNTGWVVVTGMNATITSGDFFIVIVQNEPSPDCAYIGIDETLPIAYMSYSREVSSGGAWALSPYQDFIIRAVVSSPVSGDGMIERKQAIPVPVDGMFSQKKPETVKGFQGMKAMISAPEEVDNTLSAVSYLVYRIFVADPNAPIPPASPAMLIANPNSMSYVDGGAIWLALPQWWYAYGIAAIYPNGDVSSVTYTNLIGHRMTAELTINVNLSCENDSASGTNVYLISNDYPYENFSAVLDHTGTILFDPVYKGDYSLNVYKPGYEPYTTLISVDSNQSVSVWIDPVTFPPRNLYVESTTLVATWEEPLAILLEENFESGIYPPTGWQSTTEGLNGWHVSTDGSSSGFSIPPHTAYAVMNDDEGGPGNNGCCDYLITPQLNLTVAPSFVLSFQSFFSGASGQMAYVEMSTDGGSSWTPIYTCSPAGSWQQVDVDLSAYSGQNGLSNVLFAFHADDEGNQASGWAVDDIYLTSGGLPYETFSVMLDGVEVGQTSDLVWTFDPATLNCGQHYSVCVSAIYCGVHSENICDTVVDLYNYFPMNLEVDTSITASSGAAILTWDAPVDSCLSLVGYNIYRDWEMIANLPPTDSVYWDMNLLPGYYCYYITAIYDLTPWGITGTGESQAVGPVCTDIIYGSDLPFADDFSSGQFNPDMWIPGPNWLIDSESDNPVPAAKFKWDPLLQNYSSALESYWINATGIDSSSFEYIWFDFDIKLDDTTSSSTEYLTVEVWDSTNLIPALEYTNNGSFDWTHVHLNISDLSKDRVFKVRFRANGISSDAVHFWAVDNVEIYTQTVFPPPLNLLAEPINPTDNDIRLTWEAPGYGSNSFLLLSDNPVIDSLKPNSGAQSKASNFGDSYDTLSGFNIYRRDASKHAGDFVKIATVDSIGYMDMDLSVYPISCYEYYITALYDTTESVSSNFSTACLYTNIGRNEPEKVKLYPNPAKTFIKIDLTKEVNGISVYNLLGKVISEWRVKGENTVTINTSAYPSGVYSIKFTTTTGEIFSRKFIVTR